MEHYLKALESIMKQEWKKPALCDYKGDSFTYRDIATLIAKLHIIFRKAGIEEGDKISICAKNSARWAISFLSANTYGAVAVPILADFTPAAVESLVNHSDSVVLFTDDDIWKKLDPSKVAGLKLVFNVRDLSILHCADPSVRDTFNNLASIFESMYPMGFRSDNIHYPKDNDRELAVINYTSGTTSSPKGVMLRYECINTMLDFCKHNLPCNPKEDKIVSMLPLAHMYGLMIEFIYPCSLGSTVYFLGKTPSPTLLLNTMAEVKPFLVVTVPLVIEKIYKASIKPALDKWYMKILTHLPIFSSIIYGKIGESLKNAFGGKVKLFTLGGAPLSPEVEKCLKKIKLPYTVGYGMTEASPLIAYVGWKDYVPGSCGKPCYCTEIKIDSCDPHKVVGEILIKGSNVCSGYYKNDEANAAAFTPDGYLRTGDLGIFDSHGNLFIRGRSKSMILTASGQNIYPEEVEAVVNSQKFVGESVVIERASKLVALVYLDKDAIKRSNLDQEAVSDIPDAVRQGANRLLPAYSQISKVEVMMEPFEKTPKMSIKRFLYT